MWKMKFDQDLIHDFDIVEDLYLVLYCDKNTIKIYEISMKIYWSFKMLLPLYEGNRDYGFFKGEESGGRVVRSIAGNFMTILMFREKTDTQDYSA